MNGMKSIDIFVNTDTQQDFLLVNMRRQRKLDENAVDRLVLIETIN